MKYQDILTRWKASNQYEPHCTKLHPSTKKAWVKHLRSGDYKQGKSYLKGVVRDSGQVRHCCLGVLADMRADMSNATRDTGLLCHISECHYIVDSDGVTKFSGMIPHGYAGIEARTSDFLAGLNDGGATFKQIAKFIEEEL